MKTAVAIFLILLLITTHTPFGEIIKLPVLIEHFYKHKNQDGVSILKFFTDHYTTDHSDADESEDAELPFKTLIMQSIGFAVLPDSLKTGLTLVYEAARKRLVRNFYTTQQHLCSIFHPPQF